MNQHARNALHQGKRLNRRRFLQSTAAIGAGITFLPRGLGAVSANEKLNVANVGVGGMGAADRGALKSHPNINYVAFADVDAGNLGQAAAEFPDAATFDDYRVMFDKMGDKFDAVHIATPDHCHAAVTMMALNRGKHVYCQKPLCHEIFEARMVTEKAREMGVVTQMGIQIHSHEVYRTGVATIQSGVIGKIKEVHSWSNKGWGYEGPWPNNEQDPPAGLNWDVWNGPAPFHKYAPGHYHPGNWRKWVDFGTGTMGDMSVHILDPVCNALELTAPTVIKSTSPPPPSAHGYGLKNKVHYTFPATKYTIDNFKLTWYDGGYNPDATDWPIDQRQLPGQGSMFIGEKGAMLLPHIGGAILLPREDFKDTPLVRMGGNNHWHQWVDACIGKDKTSAHFDYAGQMTEWVLLGVLANRLPGRELKWDAKALKFTNDDEATARVRREYRKGFEVEGL